MEGHLTVEQLIKRLEKHDKNAVVMVDTKRWRGKETETKVFKSGSFVVV